MRLSSLVPAVLFLFLPFAFAQHSSGGGSSSGGGGYSGGSSSSGSASSSGSSHSSYSSGSSSGSTSSSTHPSGTSASARSSSYAGSASRNSTTSPATQGQIENNAAIPNKNSQPQHKGLIARLHHPFRKPKPIEAGLRPSVCKDKSCTCPAGETYWKNGCIANAIANNFGLCQHGEYSNGACEARSSFRLNDCANVTFSRDRQARLADLAEQSRQSACSRDATAQECAELTAKSQDEAARYKSVQQEYERCRRQQTIFTTYRGSPFLPYGHVYSFGSYTVDGLPLDGFVDPAGIR